MENLPHFEVQRLLEDRAYFDPDLIQYGAY